MNGELKEDYEYITDKLAAKITWQSVDDDMSDWISEQVEGRVPVMTGDLMGAMADNPNLAQRTLDGDTLAGCTTLADIASRLYADELRDRVADWYESEILDYEDCDQCGMACHESELIQAEDDDTLWLCPTCNRRNTIKIIAKG